MKSISLLPIVGSFAENKDKARMIRLKEIEPLLLKNQEVIIDFNGVEGATQSFVHALISELIRTFGSEVLDLLYFRNCNEIVKKIIGIVVDYMQESQS